MAIYGIDLGTTNSLIAQFHDGEPKLISNAHGEFLTPSVVGVADDGTILIGKAAKDRLLSHPALTVASFKRFMGSAHSTKLGKTVFRPEELSALILRSLKEDAETQLGEPITDVIISVPAYFNDNQRKATIDAGKLAGLNVRRIVNEPTAAALAYGLNEKNEGKFLIFDLGGGTFDVSIIDKFDGVVEVRATTGDTQLGGNDFTSQLEDFLCQKHGIKFKSLSPTDRAQLKNTAEGLKIALSNTADVNYAIQIGSKNYDGSISRPEFDAAIAGLLQRLRAPVERAVADAGLSPDELDAIVLVGGATRMLAVRSLVARLFGRMPLMHLDPDTTIALGAAVQAGLVERDKALDDVILTDVCPYTLGIATVAGDDHSQMQVTPIIQRNMIVPISRAEIFRTVQNRQTEICVEVYQGENFRPVDNVFLGKIDVTVPPSGAGAEGIEVRFTYDINGALEVKVKTLSTGRIVETVFQNNSGLSPEELKQRFAALESIKLHPRDQVENSALLNRAERLYAENISPKRDEIRQAMAEFLTAIQDGHVRNLGPTRQNFSDFLDLYEPFRFQS